MKGEKLYIADCHDSGADNFNLPLHLDMYISCIVVACFVCGFRINL